ncbi:uncharacterized protein LOC126614179 [Malus sylvestris]|uniref:uncharacterized protein LOC126614179 n=1 Tax=Malus sylvestris TaxID=3752 RepID=UPI0021AC7F3E|nr:uncharacterized protein LOC126614179 [Malus sylvestris]
MTNLAKLEYAALDITGKNYLTWVLDTKIHLEAGNLGDTIREESSSSSQNRAKAMIFIRRHLDEALKMAEYNSALFRITSQMKLCGDTITDEILLEKTYNTFHANNALLQQQYRAREVNDTSLEVNATSSGGNYHKQGRGHKRGRWNKKGKNHGGQFHNQVQRHNSGPSFKNVNRHKGKANMTNAPRNSEGACHRCGGNGHWVRTCRQFDATHLDVSDFITERGNEVYRSD